MVVRVPSKGANLWFVLFGLLVVLPLPVWVYGHSPSPLLWLPALAAFLWTLFGAKRCLELNEQIVVHYLCRQRLISWAEIKDFEFYHGEGRVPTGIPFLDMPIKVNQLFLYLEPRGSISIDIDPTMEPVVYVALKHWLPPEVLARFHAAQDAALAEALAATSGRPWRCILTGVLIFGMATLWSTTMWDEVHYGELSEKWPSAAATVRRFDIGVEEGKRGRMRQYFPIVQYSYNIAGRDYTGDRFHFARIESTNQRQIERLLEETLSRPVTVRYNPADPTMSVLIPGKRPDTLLQFMFGTLVAIAALIFSVWCFFHPELPEASPDATA